jgi:REP element-mobilizing transposase RayT
MLPAPESPRKGYGALRRGRFSISHAEYFLTANLDRTRLPPRFVHLGKEVIDGANQLETDQFWTLRSMVVMPDHVHLLVRLTEKVELSSAMRLFKGRLSTVLRKRELHWQGGYFDHRLRPDEDRLPIFRYIFLNPYQAGLVSADQRWPGYFCSTEDLVWFGPLTMEQCPFPEWLR